MEKFTARLEAFSDGIFGVAITLLGIEIGIAAYSNPTNANLWQKIVEKTPEYFAYFNSFATVFLIWIGHNRMFDRIYKSSHKLLLLNGFLLLLVVLFPFPTKTVGTFINTSAANTAVAFYSGFTAVIVFSMLLLNNEIISHPDIIIAPDKNIEWFKQLRNQQVKAVFIYIFASVLSIFSPICSLFTTFAMWVFWAIVTKEDAV
ncbi:MAG TPA: TMEM175 family protein [Chitinophagales bacterium]|nr:TMEM175 family protein [Chitinophagales bacterium]